MPPEQLDWCAHCNAPIYMESVAGACTCPEGSLRALQLNIEKRQARRAHVVSTPRHAQDLGAILMADARRATGLGIPVQPANIPPGVNLEDLWTSTEIEGNFGPVVNAEDAFPIEFDEVPMDTGPRPTSDRAATRFRVDRGAPRREPFRAGIEPGPQGGPMREVGQARGYPILREQRLAGLRPGERYFVSEPEYVGTYEAPSPRQAAPKPVERAARRPTVYERLASSFLDEDDD